MRLIDIVKKAEKLKGEDIQTLFLWAVDAEFTPFVFETRLGRDKLTVYFKPVSYRQVVRFYTIQELTKRAQIYPRLYLSIPYRNIYFDLLADGISQTLLNDQPVDTTFIRTHPKLEGVVGRLILIINGLDEAVGAEFQNQLNLLEEIAYAYFSDIAIAPAWAAPLLLSYQIFKEGGIWSKPVPVDEPYLLWRAWLAIARGEKRYYDAKFSSSSSGGSSTSISLPLGTLHGEEAAINKAASEVPVQIVSALKDAIDVDQLMEVLKEMGTE
jgi:hypothetical protein